MLAKLDEMPMFEWNFKGEDLGGRHIGPIAQDFYDAFHLNGPDKKKISHIDPAGVAIVGVKGLLKRIQEMEGQNVAKDAVIAQLKAELAQLKAFLCGQFPSASMCLP